LYFVVYANVLLVVFIFDKSIKEGQGMHTQNAAAAATTTTTPAGGRW